VHNNLTNCLFASLHANYQIHSICIGRLSLPETPPMLSCLCRGSKVGQSVKSRFAECCPLQRTTLNKTPLCRVSDTFQRMALDKWPLAECQKLSKVWHTAKWWRRLMAVTVVKLCWVSTTDIWRLYRVSNIWRLMALGKVLILIFMTKKEASRWIILAC